jgi:hypothetical protein
MCLVQLLTLQQLHMLYKYTSCKPFLMLPMHIDGCENAAEFTSSNDHGRHIGNECGAYAGCAAFLHAQYSSLITTHLPTHKPKLKALITGQHVAAQPW